MPFMSNIERALASIKAQSAKGGAAPRKYGPPSPIARTAKPAPSAGFDEKSIRERREAREGKADPVGATIAAQGKQDKREGYYAWARSAVADKKAREARGEKSLGGLAKNFGSGALDFVTNLPSLGVTAAEGLALGPAILIEKAGGLEPGTTERMMYDLSDAGEGVVKGFGRTFAPFYEAGQDAVHGRDPRKNLGEGLNRAYQDPFGTVLNTAGAVSGGGMLARGAARAGSAGARRAGKSQFDTPEEAADYAKKSRGVAYSATTEARKESYARTKEAARKAHANALAESLSRSASKSILPGSARYLPPKVRSIDAGENTAIGARGPGKAETPKDRRPLTPNMLTRPIQRAGINAATRVAGVLERKVEGSESAFLQPVSRTAKYNRTTATAGRDVRLGSELELERRLAADVARSQASTRALVHKGADGSKLSSGGTAKWTSDQAEGALALHAMDAINVPGKTFAEARDSIVQMMQGNLNAAKKTAGSKSKYSQRTIDQIASVPEALLDLRGGPRELRVALNDYRDLARASTYARVNAKTLTRHEAEAVRKRHAQIAHGEAKYDPEYVNPTRPVLAARKNLDDAIKMRDAAARPPIHPGVMDKGLVADVRTEKYMKSLERVAEAQAILDDAIKARGAGPQLTPRVAVKRAFSAGKVAGRGARNVELSPRLSGMRVVPKIPSPEDLVPGSYGRSGYVVRGGAKAQVPRPTGISAGQGASFQQVLRGDANHWTTKLGVVESGKLVRAVEAARRDLSKAEAKAKGVKSAQLSRDVAAARERLAIAENEAKGGFTPSARSDLGRDAVYFPDIPVDLLGPGKPGTSAGAFGKLTQDKINQSHGTLFGMGNINISSGVPVAARAASLVDELHPAFAKEVIERFAFKREDGSLVSGSKAVEAMEVDHANVVLVSKDALEKAMTKARVTPEGQKPSDPFAGLDPLMGAEGIVKARGMLDDARDDLIAMPKAALTGIREGWNIPADKRLAFFDTPQRVWKRITLGLAPRYYVNSTVGGSSQYIAHTGFDLVSMWQARLKKPTGQAVPTRISGSTSLTEIGSDMSGRRQRAAARKPLGPAGVGLRFQGAVDSLLKRSSYIHELKKLMREGGTRTRFISNEALAKKLENAERELKVHAIKESEMFFGDYLRLSPVERSTLRRLIPFYTWLRTAAKMAVLIPVRYPKRTAFTNLAGRASQEMVNPDDPLQANLWDKGRINFGSKSLRTSGWNTLMTIAPTAKSLFDGDLEKFLRSAAGMTSPVIQTIVNATSATTGSGAPVTHPPGYNGSSQAYGQPTRRRGPTSGQSEFYSPSVNAAELAFRMLPLGPTIARAALSGEKVPYDTTTMLDLLTRSKADWELFRPEYDRAMKPIPYVGAALGWLGLNIQERDYAVERMLIEKRERDLIKSERETAKRQRKAERRDGR